MKKQIRALLLVLALVLLSVMNVFATENDESASAEWSAEDFTYGTQSFVIYPAAEYGKQYTVEANVITGLSESGTTKAELNKTLVIPATDGNGNKIQGIGDNALKSLGFTSVTFPEGVKAAYDDTTWETTGKGLTERGDFFIGSSAFLKNNFTTLNLPDGVIYVGGNAFKTNKLTSVTFPKSIMMVGNAAFGQNSITTLEFPEETDFAFQADNMAFAINQIQEVQLPANTEKLHKWAFMQNTGIEPITSGTAAEKKGGLVHMYMNAEEAGPYMDYQEKGTSVVQSLTFGKNHEHTYDEWRVEVAPTCTANGTERRDCTDCVVYETREAEMKGHAYDAVVTAPTCTEEGYTTYTCSACKDTYTADKTEAKGHSYKTVVTKKATFSAKGEKKTKCSNCGHVSKTATIYKISSAVLSCKKYTYTGKVKTPAVTVKDSKGNVLVKNKDYTLTYSSGRKNTGKYTVTIKFKGVYDGKKVLTFYILPGKTSKVSTIKTKTTLKASYSKATGATGYKVQLLSSSGKVLRTRYTTKLNWKFTELKKSTTYKVKITAYKTINGTKYMSLKSYTVKATTKAK